MQNITVQSLIGIVCALGLAFGVAWAGSHNGITVAGIPLVFVCAATAFLIQWVVFIPAWIYKTEHYFDLTGSITYLSLLGIVVVTHPAMDVRGFIIVTLVATWAIRLGTFLFSRVKVAGFDRRFNRMKTIFWQFLMTWTLQGLWVFLTLSAGLTAMSSVEARPPGIVAAIGVALWVFGFGVEVIADAQKTRFRSDPANRDQFIREGLWAWSRHPNYFGEIVLWIGIALIALPVLSGWQYVTLISPIFVFVLLNYISGVRMLEVRAERQWGDDAAYRAYKAATPSLILMPPRALKSA